MTADQIATRFPYTSMNLSLREISLSTTQRVLDATRVQRLYETYDEGKRREASVNIRTDGIRLLDGQHSIAALRRVLIARGYTDLEVEAHKISVRCYNNLTDAEEAEVTLALNAQKPHSALKKYQLAVDAGQTPEEPVERLLRAMCLSGILGTKGCEHVVCVNALTFLYRQHGQSHLARVMRAVRDGYHTDDPSRLHVQLIRATSYFFLKWPAADVERLVRMTKQVVGGGTKIRNQGANRVGRKRPLPQAIASVLCDEYNTGLRSNRLE